MRKRLLSIFIASVTAVISAALIFGGCSKDGGKTSGDIKIWSTYNTLKVMRQKHDYPELPAEINVTMAKNETEGAQLVITPEKDIDYFKLNTSDLRSDAGDLFSKDNINVFVQTYIDIKEKTSEQKNDAYPVGYIPDMLLPYKYAGKEELSVKQGENCGITVEFTSESSHKSGIYRGVFRLETKNAAYDIPVTLKIWDIAIDKNYGMTSFGLDLCHMLAGELDSTWDSYINYYETMLNDYKINAVFVPYFDVSPEKMAESVLKYYDNPNFASYSIPFYYKSWLYPKAIDKGSFYDYVMALARKCTKEKIVFDKCYLYMILNDEPWSKEDYMNVNQACADVDEVFKKVFDELAETDFFKGDEEYEEKMKASLKGVAKVVTSAYSQFSEDRYTYCPLIYNYNNLSDREQYDLNAEKTGTEKWLYTAMQLYPWASCAIDDYAIGNRIMGWMKKAYNVTGYLYYDAAIYNNFVTGETIDPYTNPVRFSNASGVYPGDGYIFYPKIKYGADKPIGSFRAVNYRDMQEDYSILCIIENKMNELAGQYGASLDGAEVFGNIYDRIFDGAKYNPDDKTFYEARDDIYRYYCNMTGESGYLAKRCEMKGSVAKIVLYTRKHCNVTVNGRPASSEAAGNGLVWTYEKAVGSNNEAFDVEVKKNGTQLVTDKIYAGSPVIEIGSLSLKTTENYMGVSDGGTMTAAGDKAEFKLVSCGDTVTERLSFNPLFALKAPLFDHGFADMDTLSLKMENKSGPDVRFDVVLVSDSGEHNVCSVTIPKAGVKEITVQGIGRSGGGIASGCNRIEFRTSNIDSLTHELLPDRIIGISDIRYTLL